MIKHGDIPFRWDIPDVRLTSEQQNYVIKLRKAEFDGSQAKLFKEKTKLSPSKSFFTQTAFGRTLSARNSTGKTVRNIGGTALAVGLGLLGIDGDIVQTVAHANPNDWMPILNKVEDILLVLGGIITAVGQIVDKSEITRERWDEKEIADSKQPLARKLNPKRK